MGEEKNNSMKVDSDAGIESAIANQGAIFENLARVALAAMSSTSELRNATDDGSSQE